MTRVVAFTVEGTPVEQGSKQAGVTKDGRPYLYDTASVKHRLKPWRKAIATAAAEALNDGPMIVGAVALRLEFAILRPKTVTRAYPSVRPDIDKLLRAVMDGISDSGVLWEDDARVVRVDMDESYSTWEGIIVRITALETEGNL